MQFVLVVSLFTGAFSFISIFLRGQDPNFSQYQNLPVYLNPALSGSFEGSYRAILAHRNQGNSLFNEPYVTLSSSFDLRLPIKYDGKLLNDAAGVGVMFLQDRNAAKGWNTQSIYVSGAFHKSINPTNKQFISAGFQLGIVQKSIGYSKLTFEDQFNGTNNYSDPTNEILPANNFAFSDMVTGIQYSFMTMKQFGGFLGASLAHFNRPNQSFYQDNILFVSLINNRPLQMRYTLHGGLQIPVTELVQVHPRFLAQKQGNHLTGMGGLNLRTTINEINNTSLHIGSAIRPSISEPNKPRVESLIILLGLELNELLLGFTYDVGLSNEYSAIPGRRNALEITITYMGKYKNDQTFCPKF
jgi:type IX secretion system PorP/SprF family membrane protein